MALNLMDQEFCFSVGDQGIREQWLEYLWDQHPENPAVSGFTHGGLQ